MLAKRIGSGQLSQGIRRALEMAIQIFRQAARVNSNLAACLVTSGTRLLVGATSHFTVVGTLP